MKPLKVHQYLLMKRECRTVLGHRASNLILLTLVLTATLFAVAFSSASMDYLQERMDNPFTNWVNIELFGKDPVVISDLKDKLSEDSIKAYYKFESIQSEYMSSLSLVDTKGESFTFSTFFYENLSNKLIDNVLESENVVKMGGERVVIDSIYDGTLGVIMTLDALHSLGYDIKNIPAYVDYYAKSENADSLGITLLDKEGYARSPLPLLAVVKRLPMNKDIVASTRLHMARLDKNGFCPVDLCNKQYANELFFFVSDKVNFNTESIKHILPSGLKENIRDVKNPIENEKIISKLKPWKKGNIVRIYTFTNETNAINKIENEILNYYSNQGVERIYNYDNSTIGYNEDDDNILSVNFDRLDSISAFEYYVKKVSDLQIEMTQVNAGKNFAAVSNLANVLTFAMIVFSIISIIIFIVNMMQSYFQKVKRNLGTFKAFGLSTMELIGVYVMIIVGIVLIAIVVAMAIVWITQISLPKREGDIGYLDLGNSLTLWTIVIIIASALASVLIVMRRLLRQTPGNLIYDR